jgi:hypothetical protein
MDSELTAGEDRLTSDSDDSDESATPSQLDDSVRQTEPPSHQRRGHKASRADVDVDIKDISEPPCLFR